MEVKINREIRSYTEAIFFGLSMRQFIFSILAMAVAVGLYFLLKPHVGTETVSWMCVLGAAPFAALGFLNYHGMTAEQFLWAWLKSEMLEPKQLRSVPTNYYYEALRDSIAGHERELAGKKVRATRRRLTGRRESSGTLSDSGYNQRSRQGKEGGHRA